MEDEGASIVSAVGKVFVRLGCLDFFILVCYYFNDKNEGIVPGGRKE